MNLFPIIGPEVGAEYPGDKRYYNKFLTHPTFPGGMSGVTIGFGYDLGFNSRDRIKSDWQGLVNGNCLVFLISCSGVKGLAAKKLITPTAKIFTIPYEVAEKVFMEKTLVRVTDLAIATFPGLADLNNDTQGVIVGLVYNRGSALVGDRRTEMAALVPAIANKDYKEIAFQIDKMKRLWVGNSKGLVTRREDEARIVLASV